MFYTKDTRAIDTSNDNLLDCDAFPTDVNAKVEIINRDPFNQSYRVSASYCWLDMGWLGCWSHGGGANNFSVGNGGALYDGRFSSCSWGKFASDFEACFQRVIPDGNAPKNFNDYDKNTIVYTCAFGKNESTWTCWGCGSRKDLIGCIPTPNNPSPPIFNDVIYPGYEPYLEIPEEGRQESWFKENLSTFEAPVAKIRLGGQSISISYDMTNSSVVADNQNCKSFPDSQIKYCVTVNADNPSNVCVYEGDVKNNKIMGCIPRPSMIQNSNIMIVPYYKTFVGYDGSRYQGIIPLLIKGAKLNEEIGWDTDNAPIGVFMHSGNLNINYYTVSKRYNDQGFICDLFENTKDYGTNKCNLKNYVKVYAAKYEVTTEHSNSAREESIREIFPIYDENNKIGAYIHEQAILNDYKVSIKALVPRFDMGQQGLASPVKLKAINYPKNADIKESYKNCLMIESNYNGGTYFLPLSTNRDNRYCYCGKENSGCEASKDGSPKCACPICENKDSYGDSMYCPGSYPDKNLYYLDSFNSYYSSSNNFLPDNVNLKNNSPLICIASAETGWDFISGRGSISSGGQTIDYFPDLICTKFPGCPSTTKADPAAKNTIWPNESKFGEKSFGECQHPYIPINATVKYRIANRPYNNYGLGDLAMSAHSELTSNISNKFLPVTSTWMDNTKFWDSSVNNKKYISTEDREFSNVVKLEDSYPDSIECIIDVRPIGTCFGGVYGKIKNPCVKADPPALRCKIIKE